MSLMQFYVNAAQQHIVNASIALLGVVPMYIHKQYVRMVGIKFLHWCPLPPPPPPPR